MRFDKVILVVTLSYTKDAIGQEIATQSLRQIYANEFYLSAAEFYEAGRNGLKPERQYQVRACDYSDETELVVDGVQFEIIRVDRRGEWTRLTCQRFIGNVPDVEVS